MAQGLIKIRITSYNVCYTKLLRLSKFLVRDFFESQDYPYLLLTPFFNLVSVWNKGVSFSMFTSYSVYGPYLLSFLALAIIAVLISWFRKEKDQRIRLAISFVIGGALSNVSDRLLFGAVYDFLDFYFKTYHWPVITSYSIHYTKLYEVPL